MEGKYGNMACVIHSSFASATPSTGSISKERITIDHAGIANDMVLTASKLSSK
jgi:hypothetical protein